MISNRERLYAPNSARVAFNVWAERILVAYLLPVPAALIVTLPAFFALREVLDLFSIPASYAMLFVRQRL